MSDADEKLIYGNLHIHPASRTVYVDGQEITLTRMEFDVLCFLASNPNMAFTGEQIYGLRSLRFPKSGRSSGWNQSRRRWLITTY